MYIQFSFFLFYNVNQLLHIVILYRFSIDTIWVSNTCRLILYSIISIRRNAIMCCCWYFVNDPVLFRTYDVPCVCTPWEYDDLRWPKYCTGACIHGLVIGLPCHNKFGSWYIFFNCNRWILSSLLLSLLLSLFFFLPSLVQSQGLGICCPSV